LLSSLWAIKPTTKERTVLVELGLVEQRYKAVEWHLGVLVEEAYSSDG
jgi:hypothetical protein